MYSTSCPQDFTDIESDEFFRTYITENTPVVVKNVPVDLTRVREVFNKAKLKTAYGEKKVSVAPLWESNGGLDKWLEPAREWNASSSTSSENKTPSGCSLEEDASIDLTNNSPEPDVVLAVAGARVETTVATFIDNLPSFYADGANCLAQSFSFLRPDVDSAENLRLASSGTTSRETTSITKTVTEKLCPYLDLRNDDIWIGETTKSRAHYDNQDNFRTPHCTRKSIFHVFYNGNHSS